MPWKFVCDLRFHEVLQTTISICVSPYMLIYTKHHLYVPTQ